jgi:transposase
MKKLPKYFPKIRERAVRLVHEHRGDSFPVGGHAPPNIGCATQTLQRQNTNSGVTEGVRTEERERIKVWEREIKELKLESTFFFAGGTRPPSEVIHAFIDQHRDIYEVEQICKVLQLAPPRYRLQGARRGKNINPERSIGIS